MTINIHPLGVIGRYTYFLSTSVSNQVLSCSLPSTSTGGNIAREDHLDQYSDFGCSCEVDRGPSDELLTSEVPSWPRGVYREYPSIASSFQMDIPH